jgi:hypothetical protein
MYFTPFDQKELVELVTGHHRAVNNDAISSRIVLRQPSPHQRDKCTVVAELAVAVIGQHVHQHLPYFAASSTLCRPADTLCNTAKATARRVIRCSSVGQYNSASPLPAPTATSRPAASTACRRVSQSFARMHSTNARASAGTSASVGLAAETLERIAHRNLERRTFGQQREQYKTCAATAACGLLPTKCRGRQ